jgi:hypothetical protein
MALSGMRRLLAESRPSLVVEFHTQETWDTGRALFGGDYVTYDISSGMVIPPGQVDFVHQCLFIPTERATSIRLPWPVAQKHEQG